MTDTQPTPPARQPLDPIEKPIWRLARSERRAILEPFIGEWVVLERWASRVASGGDRTYRGTLVAVAQSTILSAADFAILQTVEGVTWAISTAQIAHLRLGKDTR
jgi:hypothetical protein